MSPVRNITERDGAMRGSQCVGERERAIRFCRDDHVLEHIADDVDALKAVRRSWNLIVASSSTSGAKRVVRTVETQGWPLSALRILRIERDPARLVLRCQMHE